MAVDGNALEQIAQRYRRFADVEAQAASPQYAALARVVVQSPALLTFLAGLPAERQQPNLFLAAVRATCGVPGDGAQLQRDVDRHGDAIAALMRERTTQTNEPARCAVLLPVLARLAQPLALIEVGASAGLCLLPDRYGYDYGGSGVAPTSGHDATAPVFRCRANAATPLPAGNVEVVWRAGLDLNPLDVTRDADMAWLQTLVWPEQQARSRRLADAIAVARRDPPRIVAGDLLSDLPALAATAPTDATLVIYHTAVLSYVSDAADRAAFADTIAALDAVWICNESPRVMGQRADAAPPPPEPGLFLMSVDGRPVAWTGPHGQSIHWFD